MSPALAEGFLTTVPPRKSCAGLFINIITFINQNTLHIGLSPTDEEIEAL